MTWKPVDPYANGSTIDVIIYQTHSWTLNRFPCDQALIDSLGWYNDGSGAFSGQPFLQCLSTSADCTASGYPTISERTYCTDFSNSVQISSGGLIKRITLSRSTSILIGFTGSVWASEIRLSNGASANAWRVVTKIDPTKNYPINSSPGMSLTNQ